MQITALTALALALSATALPPPPAEAQQHRARNVVSMAARPSEDGDGEEWTIKSLTRQCSADEQECVWRFVVGGRAGSTLGTACEHKLVGLVDGTPASRIRGSGTSQCIYTDTNNNQTNGAVNDEDEKKYNYTVTSGWSDQFGDAPEQAFTTLSVVDYDAGLLVYPSYTDAEVRDGTPVEPDRSFPVQLIPGNVQ